MLSIAEMMQDSVVEQVSIDNHSQFGARLQTDEQCLEVMRTIIQEYIAYCRQNPDDSSARQSFKHRYEEWRQMVRDETLRAFTAFELMEKLYWQDHLARG